MKKIIYSFISLFVFIPLFAVQAETLLVLSDKDTGKITVADTNTSLYLYEINHAWASDVCYLGIPEEAKAVIEKMADNEGLDEPLRDEDGNTLENVVKVTINKSGVLRLKVKVYDEHGGYEINRKISTCSSSR